MSSSLPVGVVRYEDAHRIVLEHAAAMNSLLQFRQEPAEIVASLGRVLAEPVWADRDQPPFPRSTRDGFACRSQDLGASEPLRVVGLLSAGEAGVQGDAHFTLGPGEAVEIMTGAPVPSGADCVVMVEHVHREGDALRLSESRRPAAGDNIVPRAAEARAGDTVLPSGSRLTPTHIGTAAACGRTSLRVYTRPRVAIVATGNELVEADRSPLAHQIRNSNSYSLAAQVHAAGGEALRLPIARDEPAHLETVIRAALQSELLLLSGGVSMGRYDYVEQVLHSMGAEFFFTGALIQPGKPVVFGRLALPERSLYFFGLPGNPVSTLVTFSLFVAPFLSVLCGEPVRSPQFVLARIARDVDVKPGLTRFLPAVLRSGAADGGVEPVAWQGSGDLAAASRSNCFLVVPADRPKLSAGETVSVLLA